MLSYQLLGSGPIVLFCIGVVLRIRYSAVQHRRDTQERIRKASERCKARARGAHTSEQEESPVGRSKGIAKGTDKLPRYGKLKAEELEWIRQYLGE